MMEAMLKLLENSSSLYEDDSVPSEEQMAALRGLMSTLREVYFSDQTSNGKTSTWMAPEDLYNDLCQENNDWVDLIRSLRLADDDIHLLHQTNVYVDHMHSALMENLKGMRSMAECSADVLEEISDCKRDFNKAMNSCLSKVLMLKREMKKEVKFKNLARKSKSAESSHKVCSFCGLLLKDHSTRTDKSRKKKTRYGRFCSACGMVEVPSQNSFVRCVDCKGEILFQSVCSSCDSLKDVKGPVKIDKACSTCSLKKNCEEKSNQPCVKCKESDVQQRRNARFQQFYMEESSCCSDCEFTSSCDISERRDLKLQNWSSEKFPETMMWSDSENLVGVQPFSHDYDVSSSISSSGTEKASAKRAPHGKIAPHVRLTRSSHDQLARVAEETMDDEFNTPKEALSIETLQQESSSDQTTQQDLEWEKGKSSSESEVFLDAEKPQSETNLQTEDVFEDSKEDLSSESDTEILNELNSRVQKASLALEELTEGNVELEEGMASIENISQQNLKLSLILREIMIGMASHLEFLQKQIDLSVENGKLTDLSSEVSSRREQQDSCEAKSAGYESDRSSDFEEALEDLPGTKKVDSDGDLFFDIPVPEFQYFCLECGVGTSYSAVDVCAGCGTRVTPVQNIPENKKSDPLVHTDTLLKLNDLGLVDSAVKSLSDSKDWRMEAMRAAMPVYSVPVSDMEQRLDVIEKQADILKDNNDLVNVLIDNIQDKFKGELETLQSGEMTAGGDRSQPKFVGFDVSVFQYRRLIKETKESTEMTLEDGGNMGDGVRRSQRTFVEMKIEEVFKKEQQTALELEIFEQKLEVEGLIIKEKENFFACSNSKHSEEIERVDNILLSSSRESDLEERFMEASRSMLPGLPDEINPMKSEGTQDELVISIEIEVEKESRTNEKKAIRCEYKANLQKGSLKCGKKLDIGKALPTITLYPLWEDKNITAECITPDNKRMTFEEVPCENIKPIGDYRQRGDGTFQAINYDLRNEDFVEIKSPKFYGGSSDDETESCIGDWTERKKHRSVAYETFSQAMQASVVVIQPEDFIIRVESFTNRKEDSTASGMIFVQAKAVASLGVVNADSCISFQRDWSCDDFYEAKSHLELSNTSLVSTIEKTTSGSEMAETPKKSSCLIKFITVNMGGRSVASVNLLDESLPILVTDTVSVEEEEEFEDTEEVELVPPTIQVSNEQLKDALTLIQRIENDVVEVKLDSAIAILPKLESILREHLHYRMQDMQQKASVDAVSSLDVFMSSFNFLTGSSTAVQPEMPTSRKTDSDRRLCRMLELLTDLEFAVKEMAIAAVDSPCNEPKANRIYKLLQDLGTRIRLIGEEPNVDEMEKTLDLTSRLDIAVRDYNSELNTLKDGGLQEKVLRLVSSKEFRLSSHEDLGLLLENVKSSESLDDNAAMRNKVKTTKKQIFDTVASEAQEREARVERDFDRIDRLEKENAEVMRFLNTLLDKTLRRVYELDELRELAWTLRSTVEEVMEELEKRQKSCGDEAVQSDEQALPSREVSTERVSRKPSLAIIEEVANEGRTEEEVEPVKDTQVPCGMKDSFSTMLIKLDNLKTRAKEKRKRYFEIFGSDGEPFVGSKPLPISEIRKPTVNCPLEDMRSTILQFEKIGCNSFFMSWSKPQVNSEDCVIVGYEITVNGRINQRVRNPDRLKAVLYSVNPEESSLIRLYALTKDGMRRSLTQIKFPEEIQKRLLHKQGLSNFS